MDQDYKYDQARRLVLTQWGRLPDHAIFLRKLSSRHRTDEFLSVFKPMAMTKKSERIQSKLPRFDSLEQEVYLNLWRTYDRLRMHEDALFESFDLTSQQYNLLRLLKAAAPEPIPTLTLANRLVSRSPDITRMLDKLEQKQWIQRLRPESNRRQVLVSITATGTRLLRSIATPLKLCHQRQLGHMTRADLSRLRDLLKIARRPHEEAEGVWY